MKEKEIAAIQKKVSTFCQKIFTELLNKSEGDYEELMAAWREMHRTYNDFTAQNLQKWADDFEQSGVEEGDVVDILEANEAVVEFWDINTGKLFRRTLPINCMETANGIVLSGETMEGQPSKIAFLSESAMQKIHDLMGIGTDMPRHEH